MIFAFAAVQSEDMQGGAKYKGSLGIPQCRDGYWWILFFILVRDLMRSGSF